MLESKLLDASARIDASLHAVDTSQQHPAAVHLHPLTAAVVVCREARPQLDALPHVVARISACLDFSDSRFWSIPRACEHGDLRLLRRIASKQPVDMDAHYKMHLFNKGLVNAVPRDRLDIVEWLCDEYCRTGWITAGLETACALGRLQMLQWIFANHRGRVVWTSAFAERAAEHGHVHVLEWLCTLAPDGSSAFLSSIDSINSAAQHGHFNVVKWYHECGGSNEALNSGILRRAIAGGHLEIAQFLYDRGYRLDVDNGIDYAASSGNVAMVEWLHALSITGWTENAIDSAAERGHLDIIQWLHDNILPECTQDAMDRAARYGHLDVVQWLHTNRTEGCTKYAMNWAAGEGHLHIVQWLHKNRRQGCSHAAMDLAATNGHLHIVEWLHTHRREGCTRRAMDGASQNGHLATVKWLHENRIEGCSKKAMDEAAANGHLEVVQWFHETRREGCTSQAMNLAASNDHLHVVKWLHDNCHEGCTKAAMDRAGSCEMVQWLHENRSEGCTTEAMETAIERGDFESVLYLHANRTEGCSDNVAHKLGDQSVELLLWLNEHYLLMRSDHEDDSEIPKQPRVSKCKTRKSAAINDGALCDEAPGLEEQPLSPLASTVVVCKHQPHPPGALSHVEQRISDYLNFE
ncbi:Ankyrin repeat-containing protein, partial [Globisporangium splendens]